MGIFGRKRQAGVRGTARVISTSHAPQATHGSLSMNIVVEAPGIPAYSHSYKKFGARVDKWPSPGDVLPVEVDPTDPERVEVLWDDLPTGRDAARQQAEQVAAMLRQQQEGQQPGVPPEAGDIVSQLQQMFPGAVVNVEGGGEVQPPPPPVQIVASQSTADPVERLEKLARLRDAGVVTEAQFAELRTQILTQAGLDP